MKNVFLLALAACTLLTSCQSSKKEEKQGLFQIGTLAGAKLLPIQIGLRCSYVDTSGKEILAPQLGFCGEFSEGLAPVVQDGKLGYIDAQGHLAIPRIFDFEVPKKVVDTSGWEMDTLAVQKKLASYAWHNQHAWVEYQGQKGIINLQGQFKQVSQVDESYGISDSTLSVRKGETWTLLDLQGAEIQSQSYTGLGLLSSGIITFRQDSLWGWMDRKGKILHAAEFSWVFDPSEGKILSENTHGFQFYSLNSDQKSEYFQEAYPFDCGKAIAKKGQKYGILNAQMTWTAMPWKDAYPIASCRIVAQEGEFYGIYDTLGNKISSLQFDHGFVFKQGYALASQNHKRILIDSNARILWREK